MIAALIPAAGSSSRLGEPKLLIELAGQTVIGRLIGSLRAGGANRVVVVVPPSAAAEGPAVANEARRAGAEVVVPPARPASMRDSIELGLTRLAQHEPPDRLILTPGDYPGITADIVAELLEFAATTPDQIVIPAYQGRRGHPIVLPWSLAVQIKSLPQGVGVNSLVAANLGSVVELAVSRPEIVADLDTPEDLDAWMRRERDDTESPGFETGFRVSVRLFALAKEKAGRSELDIELVHGSKVADLRAALRQRLPALAPLFSTAMIAVDEEYASDEAPVSPASRLAVIPPVSGGTGGRLPIDWARGPRAGGTWAR